MTDQILRKLFSALTKADLTGSADRLLRALCRSDLVVLDEFAFKRLDQKTAEWLYMIVDNRYSTGSIILTSNRSFDDWLAIIPDKVMANAVMDRLAHNAH